MQKVRVLKGRGAKYSKEAPHEEYESRIVKKLRRVKPRPEDLLWIYNRYQGIEFIPKKDVVNEDIEPLIILTSANFVIHDGRGYALTLHGMEAYNKVSDHYKTMKAGVPFDYVKRKVTTAEEILKDRKWYRYPVRTLKEKSNQNYIMTDTGIIIKGRAIIPSSSQLAIGTKLSWLRLEDDKRAVVDTILSDMESMLNLGQRVFPYKYSRNILTNKKGLLWYASSDKMLKIPIAESYYDLLFHLSNRLLGEHTIVAVNYKTTYMLLFNCQNAGVKIKLFGDTVAVVAPYKVRNEDIP